MLENSLKEKSGKFLLGEDITQADITAYPRLLKMPQNGVLATEDEKAIFPNVIEYFKTLQQTGAFRGFYNDDMNIWTCGTFPKFIPFFWGKLIPWSVLVVIGNWRADTPSFKRITMSHVGDVRVQSAIRVVNEIPLKVLNKISLESDLNSSKPVLFCTSTEPLSVAVEISLKLMGFLCEIRYLDALKLEQYSPDYLKMMPFGELPLLVTDKLCIYGPNNIVEYAHGMRDGTNSAFIQSYHLGQLESLPAIEKAIVRRWFGWARVCWSVLIVDFALYTNCMHIEQSFT
jgi:glutathione S-transferase